MEWSDLAARIQKLEDVEAVRKLRAKYCYAVDEKRLEDTLDLFSKNARLDFGASGQCEGMESVRAFYSGNVPSHLPFTMHMAMNGDIDIEGEEGRGVWYVMLPATSGQTGDAMLAAGKYDEAYVKENGEWKFSFLKFSVYVTLSFQKDWTTKN